MNWQDVPVVVTGGASFIGSHLVDRLVELGARVTVIDNLSSGMIDNLFRSIERVRFEYVDLEHDSFDKILESFKGGLITFHLAAAHGGRGFINSHPADVSSNFAIDHRTFEASLKAGVDKVVFASSACVYPSRLQQQSGSGSSSNPYIIENMRISANSSEGINISNTNAHFIIRDCTVGAGPGLPVICLLNVTNGMIQGVSALGGSCGFFVSGSTKIKVENFSTSQNQEYGIWSTHPAT